MSTEFHQDRLRQRIIKALKAARDTGDAAEADAWTEALDALNLVAKKTAQAKAASPERWRHVALQEMSVEQAIADIEDGKRVWPSPYMNLVDAIPTMCDALNRAAGLGAPSGIVENYRRWIVMAQEMLHPRT